MVDRSRTILGLLLIVAGLLFLLDVADIIPARDIVSNWWPLILVFLGIVAMTGRPGSVTGGLILIAIGGVLLLATLDILDVPIWQLAIALFLIAGGVSLIVRGFGRGDASDISNQVTFAVILGTNRVISEASAFRKASITSILGEATLDLRKAALDHRGATVDAFCLLGDVSVLVPRDWRVVVEGMPVLGDFNDETDHELERSNEAPTITVTGVSMLADINVKHYQ